MYYAGTSICIGWRTFNPPYLFPTFTKTLALNTDSKDLYNKQLYMRNVFDLFSLTPTCPYIYIALGSSGFLIEKYSEIQNQDVVWQ